MATILLVRPANNAVAIELSNWAVGLKRLVSSPSIVGVSVDLASAGATRSAVDMELSRHELILFFGHGAPTKLLGSGVDLVDSINVGQAAYHAIVAIACSSANTLGRLAVSSGVEAYLGFTKKLVWLTSDPDVLFGPALCSGAVELMNKNDMSDALQKMKDELTKVFDYYYSGTGRTSPNAAIGFLTASWDLQHLDLLGNSLYHL